MNRTRSIAAALAVTTMLAGGMAIAATTDTATRSHQEAVLNKDATAMSADAANAYRELAATRLAIFDGRINDAKKDVQQADAGFEKAKTDRSVFVKAEADFKMPEGKTTPANTGEGKAAKAPSTMPTAWLPVDGEVILNQDYIASPQKAAAVAEANKSLAQNDRKGAAEKLKLADVDVNYIVAVVPLDQTLADVHKAADMMNGGRYYEASQMLRQVQKSIRFDVADVMMTPAGSHTAAQGPAADHKATDTK